jgi:hypothetical protein
MNPVFHRTILGQQPDAFMEAHPELEIEFAVRFGEQRRLP